MAEIALQAFRNMLADILQLAVGCIFPLLAAALERRGASLRAAAKHRLLVALLCSASGVLLPFGAFGAVPVLAAMWMAGLELPAMLSFIVSNFIFNMGMPLTSAVFVWGGNVVRVLVAFAAGAAAGMLPARRPAAVQGAVRSGIFLKFFIGHRGKTNYLAILKDYIEAAGLYILAAAVIKAAFAAGLSYWLQGQFLMSGLGLAASTGLSRLNVFSPFFTTALSILERIADFSALASLVFLLNPKPLCKLYGIFLALSLLLSVSLFIK